MSQPQTASPTKVQVFQTGEEARIYQIPLQEFPFLWGYAYLALVDEPGGSQYRVLIDTGSGFGESNQHIEDGLRAVSELEKRPLGLEDLTHVLITHGHIDHFGGLAYVRPRTQALVGVHELDLRNLTNYEERIAVVARRLDQYLMECGVSANSRKQQLEMYRVTKSLYRSVKVDFTFEAAGMRVGPFEMLHVPGHCAGHVAIRLHDIIFTGDHVLEDTSPHQSPEHLTLSTGLDHYMKSLDALKAWAGEPRFALGGHKAIIKDLPARIEAIRSLHRQRLDIVLEYLQQPHTIAEVSRHLFNEVHGYNVLLALEEAGAHVEYLYQRGLLGIANLTELDNGSVAVMYVVSP